MLRIFFDPVRLKVDDSNAGTRARQLQTVHPQCEQNYTVLDDPWRAITYGTEMPSGSTAQDVAPGSQECNVGRSKDTGVGNNR